MARLTSIDIDPYAGRLLSRRPDLTQRQGMGYRRFQEHPRDHFHPGRILGFAVDRRDAEDETA